MTDTDLLDNEYEEDELLPDLFVEKDTHLIYEVKFFDTFVLVRPATPLLYLAIKKLDHHVFCRDFEEFCGSKKAVREFMQSREHDFIIEKIN